jgi:hypothetical protein
MQSDNKAQISVSFSENLPIPVVLQGERAIEAWASNRLVQ